MSIRRTLLISFLLVGLGPAALLTLLAFERARDAMQTEIEQSIAVEAASLSTEVDRILFERLENSATWSRLDVMQDIRVSDVDKRLSLFLSELKTGYGSVYQELYCTNPQNVKIASSNVSSIGVVTFPSHGWTSARFPRAEMSLQFPAEGTQRTPTLAIRTAVPAALGERSPGALTLLFNWQEIQSLLDQAALNGRSVAILDQDGRMVAASQNLRSAHLLMTDRLKSWIPLRSAGTSSIRDGAPLTNDQVIVGVDQFHDYLEFRGFGWSTIVVEPLNTALAPVHRMALIFFGLLLLVTALTVMMALWASRTIGRPIIALTAFTRSYMRDQDATRLPDPASGEVGELTHSFAQMIEETARSRQKLIQATKLAALGEMAAVLAHEIRTPLGILRSSVQVLHREPGLGDESRELLGFLESETARLNRLISTLLDSSRPRPPHIEAIDLHALIHQCKAMLLPQAEKKRLALSESLDANDPIIDGDAEQLTQVILNLVLNAIQIVPEDGQIALHTTSDAQGLTIEVADNGPGIAPADRERIFDAFFFRRAGGVGLGLAVVKQIVQAHGGSILAAQSALGGALFSITLPRHQSGAS